MEQIETYKVNKIQSGKHMTITVPGSKSITNRALLMAALSNNKVTLNGVLFSDDSRYFLKSLQSLGFDVEIDESKKNVSVTGMNGLIPVQEGEIYVGSAGTAARFLTAMLALSKGTYIIQASEQMKKRPMKPLFEALEQLGAKFEYLEQEYFLPVRTMGCSFDTNRVSLDISKTSQPLSALLMTSVMLKDGLKIHITSEKKGGSYVEITRIMMREFGCETINTDGVYEIKPNSTYNISHYQIEPDVSAACYFYAIAALTKGTVLVPHIHKNTMQGDIQFTKVLETMGCQILDTADGIIVKGPKDTQLQGITIDMNQFSDQALTLSAIACYATSPVTIKNIGHIRLQECDRINAMTTNLKAMGITFEEGENWIKIYPGMPKAATIETFEDHRVAMSYAVTGIKSGNITISNPMCCRKTFENYFDIINILQREGDASYE